MGQAVQFFSDDPNLQANALQLQQRAALAQALMGEGMKPLETQGRQVGGIGYRISPMEGLAKMLQAYSGRSMGEDVAKQQGQLQADYIHSLVGMMGGGQQPPQQSPAQPPQQPAPDQQQAAQAALAQGAQQGSVGPTNDNASRMAAMLSGRPPVQPAPQGMPAGPAMPPQGQMPPPQGMPPQGAPQMPQGGMPPGGPQMPQGQPPGRPPVAGQQGSPMNPMGMDPTFAAYAMASDPAKYFQTLMSQMGPTDIQKIVMASGAQPGTPQFLQAMRDYVTKQNTAPGVLEQQQAGMLPEQIRTAALAKAQKEGYIAPIDAKPGTPVIDPISHKLVAYAPKSADGMSVQFGNDQNGALVPTGATAIPGYARGNASIAGAEQGAKSANTITTATSPTGATVPVWAGPAAGVGGAQLGLGGGGGAPALPVPQPAGAGGGMPTPQPTAARPPVVPSVPRLGQSTSDAAIQKSAADVIQNAPQVMQASKQTIAGLENALHVLDSQQVTKTGNGVPKAVDALAILNNMGIPVAKDDVNGYKTLHKFLANAAATGAGAAGATGSDARFAQFLEGQPNAETMTPKALHGAIQYVLSQHDAAVARAQFLPQAYQDATKKGDPNAALTAQTEWAKMYNPRVFEFSRMTPEERTQFKNSMPADQRDKFGQSYNTAHQLGWVQ
jgi:hypothetical protein